MLLQDPRQVDGAHKTVLSYKTQGRSTEHTKLYYYKQMLLQDPRQVDRQYYYKQMLLQDPKTVLSQTNALTRPEAGRRSTQNSTITNKCSYKTQAGRRSTQNSTITNKCSYKTQGRLTEHTKQYYYKQMLLQDPRQVDGAHKTVLLQTKCFYINLFCTLLGVLVRISSSSVKHKPEST